MTLNLSKPILYLITPGATLETTTPASKEFQKLLPQISVAVDAGIELIRERRSGVIGDEEHLGVGRGAAGNELIEPGPAQI